MWHGRGSKLLPHAVKCLGRFSPAEDAIAGMRAAPRGAGMLGAGSSVSRSSDRCPPSVRAPRGPVALAQPRHLPDTPQIHSPAGLRVRCEPFGAGDPISPRLEMGLPQPAAARCHACSRPRGMARPVPRDPGEGRRTAGLPCWHRFVLGVTPVETRPEGNGAVGMLFTAHGDSPTRFTAENTCRSSTAAEAPPALRGVCSAVTSPAALRRHGPTLTRRTGSSSRGETPRGLPLPPFPRRVSEKGRWITAVDSGGSAAARLRSMPRGPAPPPTLSPRVPPDSHEADTR